MNYSHLLLDRERHYPICPGVTLSRMTDAEYRSRLQLQVHIMSSPLGDLLVAATAEGICRLSFCDDRQSSLLSMQKEFPYFEISPMDTVMIADAESIIESALRGMTPQRLRLHIHCTDFQYKVCEAMLRIPCGALTTYGHIAAMAGKPKAFQATGTAVSRNPVGILIPCHRVIPADGSLGNYYWGSDIKRYLIERETRHAPH